MFSVQHDPKSDLLRHDLDQDNSLGGIVAIQQMTGNPLVPCSTSLNSTANSSPVVSSSSTFSQGPAGSRDNHVLPDLLPPQIPPRNSSAIRRSQDRALSDEVRPCVGYFTVDQNV